MTGIHQGSEVASNHHAPATKIGYKYRSNTTYLISIYASGHGPSGDYVIHDSFTEALGHLVEFKEVTDTVEHLVIAVGVGVHLLEDGGDVTKNSGIQECWKKREDNK